MLLGVHSTSAKVSPFEAAKCKFENLTSQLTNCEPRSIDKPFGTSLTSSRTSTSSARSNGSSSLPSPLLATKTDSSCFLRSRQEDSLLVLSNNVYFLCRLLRKKPRLVGFCGFSSEARLTSFLYVCFGRHLRPKLTAQTSKRASRCCNNKRNAPS